MFRDLLGMMRPFNCLMASIATVIGSLLVMKMVPAPNFILLSSVAFFVAFVVTGAGNVINDYMDVEADRVNKPKRPIPSGSVGRRDALSFSLFLFLVGLLMAALTNPLAFFIATFNSFLLIAYSGRLQNKALAGNVTVAYLTGSTFLFGGAAIAGLPGISLPFILFFLSTLATLTREIVKDLEDEKGDRKSFMKRVTGKGSKPMGERFHASGGQVKMKYSESLLISLAIASLVVAVILSFLPFYFGILDLSYLILVSIADIVFVYTVICLGWKQRKRNYTIISRRLKIGMAIAMIAFIAGIFI